MERTIGSQGGSAVVVVVVVLLANCVSAQIYTCWGGCYNMCFLSGKKSEPEKLACFYQCLPSCKPNSPPDYRYYCQIGCTLGQCSALYSDGSAMEKCFGKCSNICKF